MAAEIPSCRQRLQSLIVSIQHQSLALAIGIFDSDGNLLYGSCGMLRLLGDQSPDRPRCKYLINPSFQTFMEMTGEGHLFQGFLTVGDGVINNRSLRAQAWRDNDQLLIAAEFDVIELDHLNTEMSRTNQEINNLRRDLIKNNFQLEKALADLKRAQSMLVHSEKMNALGQLVAGVAHEINNPLGFIIGNVFSLKENMEDLSNGFKEIEILSESRGLGEAVTEIRKSHYIDYLQEDMPGLFSSTEEGLKRIKKIVDSLRTFSRLHEAERKKINIKENIESTLALAVSLIKEKEIEVSLKFEEMDGIECYPAELNQVFMNLIVNAVQAMESGGRLEISAQQLREDNITLSFTDNGMGIEPALLDKIFDPFFTTKSVGEGTGLGLSIAHQIITEQHGGQLTVRSTPGKGTCFTITIPIRLEKDK